MSCHSKAGLRPKNLLYRIVEGKGRFLAALGMTVRGARNEA
jgi:hypothetical protein